MWEVIKINQIDDLGWSIRWFKTRLLSVNKLQTQVYIPKCNYSWTRIVAHEIQMYQPFTKQSKISNKLCHKQFKQTTHTFICNRWGSKNTNLVDQRIHQILINCNGSKKNNARWELKMVTVLVAPTVSVLIQLQ